MPSILLVFLIDGCHKPHLSPRTLTHLLSAYMHPDSRASTRVGFSFAGASRFESYAHPPIPRVVSRDGRAMLRGSARRMGLRSPLRKDRISHFSTNLYSLK